MLIDRPFAESQNQKLVPLDELLKSHMLLYNIQINNLYRQTALLHLDKDMFSI